MDAWLRVGEAYAKRREQSRVCAEHHKDKAKLDQLLGMNNIEVPAQQKEAYRKEFAVAYNPWQKDIQACIDAEEGRQRADEARRLAERDRLLGVMVSIPTGKFMMGSNEGEGDEMPVHEVRVASFEIDKTEVTVAAYRACVGAKSCSEPNTSGPCNWGKADRDNHPVNCVDWKQARAFCSWMGKKLPSEEQWEYAARGTDGRKYPWGNNPPGTQLCWYVDGAGTRRSTCSVGSYPAGASPFGLLDMAGNVWEWTESGYSEGYDHKRTTTARANRGGSWFASHPSLLRAADRVRAIPSAIGSFLGFRCAR